MGNTLGLPTNDVVLLVQCRRLHSIEVAVPHAVIGLLQAAVLTAHRVREAERFGEFRVDPMRTVVWRAAPVAKPASSLLLQSLSPLVVHPPAHPEAAAQLPDSEPVTSRFLS